MKINKNIKKGKWIKYKGKVEFLIRPFSIFSSKLTPSEMDKELDMKEMFSMFDYMVIDWKGVTDENDEALPCDEENKMLVFEYYGDDIISLVFEASRKIRDEVKCVSEKASKN